MTIDINHTELSSDELTGISYRDLWAMPQPEVDAFQLRLLKKRFGDLIDKVVTLGKLASLQKVTAINAVNDVVPLLFQHTAYKSYPMTLLEKGNFKALTQWLQKLTAHDLSQIDASQCKSIDEWLQLLDDETPLSIVHSSGTSGKLSLIPRDKQDLNRFVTCRLRNNEGYGQEPNRVADYLNGSKKHVPIIYPSYRYGRYGGLRNLQLMVEKFQSQDCVYTIYSDLMSADVASLAGRVAGAEAKGMLDQLDIPEHLLTKFKQSLERQGDQKALEIAFIERVIKECQGKEVIFMGVPSILMQVVRMAKERGITKLFDPKSIIFTGGGSKGIVLPDDWKQQVEDLVGTKPYTVYGMTECTSQLAECDYGNYHITPLLIPFILDPETGNPLPREGKQTGRFAWFDLLAETYWGGFVTGDEITGHWDESCKCGRHGFYVEPTIQRYSSKSDDGNDKINCAGAADAHERALEFLNDLSKNV